MILVSLAYRPEAKQAPHVPRHPCSVTDLDGNHLDLAYAGVSGARRQMNLGLLEDGEVAVGDWVVIHLRFVLEKITEEAAADAMDGLRTIGPGTILPAHDETPPPLVSGW